MKGIFIIGFAILLDALQAAFALAFTALEAATPAGGGIAAAGACYAFGAGIIASLKCLVFGAGVSAFAVPIGAAVDVAISITFGSALIAALVFTGTFSWGAAMGGSLIEMIPLLDAIVPGWTLMAWRSVQAAKRREQEAGAQGEALLAVAPLGATPAFDGIRAANDNFYEAQLAA